MSSVQVTVVAEDTIPSVELLLVSQYVHSFQVYFIHFIYRRVNIACKLQ